MGVWAGPEWPEAGLRTKPPGSPYLGRERRAAAGGSPRCPGPATPSPRGPLPGRGAAAGPAPPANSAPLGQWAPSPAYRRGDTKAEKRGPARSQALGKWRRRRERAPERMAAAAEAHGPLLPPSKALLSPTAAAETGARTSSPSNPGREGQHTKRSGTPTSASSRSGDGPKRSGRRRSEAPTQRAPLGGRGPGAARGAFLPYSPTAPCPSSWWNLKRPRPSGCPAVRPSALPSVCTTSHWLSGGLAVLLLCLRRCRHRQDPQ